MRPASRAISAVWDGHMAKKKDVFDPKAILTGHGAGQARRQFAPGQIVYAQDDPADAAYYVENGLTKISSLSPSGKEAIVAIRGKGEFFGTRCLVARRTATTTALTACSLVRVTTSALTRMLREEPDFTVIFATYLVHQSIRDQESLIDRLINPAEKRLARTLLQLAKVTDADDPQTIPTPINQAVLANMIGTTRPRVSFFMNRFKRQGFIEYGRDGRIKVHNSLRSAMADDWFNPKVIR